MSRLAGKPAVTKMTNLSLRPQCAALVDRILEHLAGLEIVPVSHVDEVLVRALAQPIVPIEWTEADELATEPPLTQIGTDAGGSVARH